ncbi:hypothetical protein PPACK8108_LOCUS20185, partial [Phakopsora pachyrhizi]
AFETRQVDEMTAKGRECWLGQSRFSRPVDGIDRVFIKLVRHLVQTDCKKALVLGFWLRSSLDNETWSHYDLGQMVGRVKSEDSGKGGVGRVRWLNGELVVGSIFQEGKGESRETPHSMMMMTVEVVLVLSACMYVSCSTNYKLRKGDEFDWAIAQILFDWCDGVEVTTIVVYLAFLNLRCDDCKDLDRGWAAVERRLGFCETRLQKTCESHLHSKSPKKDQVEDVSETVRIFRSTRTQTAAACDAGSYP